MEDAEFFKRIDWKLLREQKSYLLNLSETSPSDDLDGVVTLIDDLQDYAVDMLGFPEDTVFELLIGTE